jgi:hypothetical protein
MKERHGVAWARIHHSLTGPRGDQKSVVPIPVPNRLDGCLTPEAGVEYTAFFYPTGVHRFHPEAPQKRGDLKKQLF